MRSRKAANDHVAEVARRRLELLGAELAGISGTLPGGDEVLAGDISTREAQQTIQTASVPETAEEVARAVDRRAGRHAQRSVGVAARAGGWLHDRLPPTLQGRVDLSSSHLTVIALLVAAALAVTAWWVLRADGGTIVPSVRPVAAAASPSPLVQVYAPDVQASAAPTAGSISGEAEPPGSAVVVIDVAGRVRRPGIATLPVGSRVIDAIKAAGGAERGVDLTPLNLARLLELSGRRSDDVLALRRAVRHLVRYRKLSRANVANPSR